MCVTLDNAEWKEMHIVIANVCSSPPRSVGPNPSSPCRFDGSMHTRSTKMAPVKVTINGLGRIGRLAFR